MRKFEGYTRGVNFGGWLSQCDHTKLRYDTFITEEDFREVSLRKFDHVRIPVDYELILSELDSFKDVTPVIGYGQQLELSRDYAFNESGFKYIDFAIEMCKKYSLNMILDLHRTPGYSFDPFHGEKGFFDSEEFQNVFHSIWIEFAKRYGKESDILTFELLNEVTKKEYSDKWNEISETTVKNIRKFAPDIHIIIGGYYNNSLEAIKDLNKPYDDKICSSHTRVLTGLQPWILLSDAITICLIPNTRNFPKNISARLMHLLNLLTKTPIPTKTSSKNFWPKP